MTYDMLDRLNITPAEVFEAAEINTQSNFPIKIDSMPNVLIGLMDVAEFDLPDDFDKAPVMYVVTNSIGTNGAAAITYPNALKQISEICGGSFFLLPSSIHELLAVPAANGCTTEELRNMVHEVNSTVVDDRDILGYSVYYYDATAKELSIA